MKFILILTSFLLSYVLAGGDYVTDNYVFELSASNFDKVVHKSNYTTIVKFYAPWCGYCKQLHPIFSKLGKLIHNDGKYAVNVAAVNCDEDYNKQLCSQYQVSGFPTIMVFRPPKYEDEEDNLKKNKKKSTAPKSGNRHAVETYNGERTLKSMWTFLQSRIKNYVKKFPTLKSESLKSWLERENGYKKVILVTETKDTSPMFKSLAIDFLSSYRFAMINSKSKVIADESIEVNGNQIQIPAGLELPVLLVLDEEASTFNTYKVESTGKKSKKPENVEISKWLVKQNGGKKPSEGPLSKKEQKYYSKYRTGKAADSKIHDEL